MQNLGLKVLFKINNSNFEHELYVWWLWKYSFEKLMDGVEIIKKKILKLFYIFVLVA